MGKNIANPLATLLSAATMFEDAFGLHAEAAAIRKVVDLSLAEGIVTEDLAGTNKAYQTTEVGDWLAANV
jgi:3-isopropylmalate dehydrogenase